MTSETYSVGQKLRILRDIPQAGIKHGDVGYVAHVHSDYGCHAYVLEMSDARRFTVSPEWVEAVQ